MSERQGYTGPRKWNWGTIALVAIFHVVIGGLLLNALAPKFTADVVERAESLVTVTITAPEDEPEPPPERTMEEPAGNEGAAGERAIPKEVTAPEAAIPNPRSSPVPRASSTGTANQSGGADSGSGTGSGDSGTGTGGGGTGDGQGAPPPPPPPRQATQPSVRSGSISEARDFPIPPGGRGARAGQVIEAIITVSVNGRATSCRVIRSTADTGATGALCPLVQSNIRFNPALDTNGDPIEARWGWRQTFSAR